MFKRLISFFSFFIILILYLQLTGLILISDYVPGFLILEGGMIGFLVWMALKYYVFDIRMMTKKDWIVLLLGIIVTIFQIILFSRIKMGGSASADELSQMDFHRLTAVLALTIVGPIMEEMTIRGILQKGAFDNSHWGIMVASIFFSLLHNPYTLVSFLNYFSAGAILGYMYKSSGNLLPSICLHILNNSMVYFIILFYK